MNFLYRPCYCSDFFYRLREALKNDWLLYLLEANIYVAVFYAFYLMVLKKETFSTINRWFLIAGTVAALVLPLAKAERDVVSAPRNVSSSAHLTDRIATFTTDLSVFLRSFAYTGVQKSFVRRA